MSRLIWFKVILSLLKKNHKELSWETYANQYFDLCSNKWQIKRNIAQNRQEKPKWLAHQYLQ